MIPIVNPPTRPATWTDLQDELDRWRQCGRCATLWWRDDDAVALSGRLDELLSIAGEIPLALAVIPAQAELALAARLDASPRPAIRVLQHGWRHRDHAAGGKKANFRHRVRRLKSQPISPKGGSGSRRCLEAARCRC